MFDVGFSELCLIGLVSLLVIGPERLPKVARLAGFWLGKTRSMVASVKEEIKLELQAEELRQIFKEQSGMAEVQQIIDETSDTLKSTIDPLPTTSRAQDDLDAGTVPEPEQYKEQLPTDITTGQHEPK
ncbi:Sec-independent protein translocase protein TatB [Methylobacter tundripaludum]|uniref:Sec-independent protein translocase protein TatB n=1 Tax=Methylobacter tundripaludum (strain ATCC BAA-1195 / DSM 17260 / SV96) TaxID=697282 RepID=G3IV43_METTV|nr:Sec-independent protein translocase protein TatB [Methylobacter tundripaludum]EGW22839.1 Sec-independent protein translocase protein tatB-like protein [Methylobacter tundripaludum SV96]